MSRFTKTLFVFLFALAVMVAVSGCTSTSDSRNAECSRKTSGDPVLDKLEEFNERLESFNKKSVEVHGRIMEQVLQKVKDEEKKRAEP